MKAKELAKKLMLKPDSDVKLNVNIRNNKTDEVELYESEDISGYLGDDAIIRTEILIK